ncbi:MAG TPA: hypothetical protein VHZ07_26485 [Bryobacteraceae bacterium]|jgi:hypothetical protein|nr:hypothetical protein [Bryobacteraceae bacterium]
MLRYPFIALIGALALAATQAPAPSTTIGIFASQSDVGNVLHPGSAEYNANSKTYTVSGSGDNMWASTDEFHFVWKQVSAQDLSLTADISMLGESKEGHRKAVLMIRQSMDDDSPYVDAARHGEGLTSLQFRDQKGAITREVESNVSGPTRLRIVKLGDRFYMWIGDKKGRLQFSGGSAHVEMQAPFYVGIGVCAHQKDVVERATFTNVDLDTNITPTKVHYSTVETVLASGDARTGFVSPKRLTAPGWNPDGHKLTFEIGGHRKEVVFTPLRTAAPVGAPITAQPESNGEYVASNQGGTMQIWHKGADGSQPEQMTSADYNSASPRLSPDGKYLLFLSYPKELSSLQENQEVTLRLITLTDKRVRTLATFVGGPGSLGTQPWSPDGRRVAFISYQTME